MTAVEKQTVVVKLWDFANVHSRAFVTIAPNEKIAEPREIAENILLILEEIAPSNAPKANIQEIAEQAQATLKKKGGYNSHVTVIADGKKAYK